MKPTLVISGGQTGADIAGLAAPLTSNIATGGWMPYGRRTESGPMPIEAFVRYQLRIHASMDWAPRTEQNIKDSHGTIIFGNMESAGSALTIKLCRLHKKPFLCLDSRELISHNNVCVSAIKRFTSEHGIKTMNIAGNRESRNPGIYYLTYITLMEAWK